MPAPNATTASSSTSPSTASPMLGIANIVAATMPSAMTITGRLNTRLVVLRSPAFGRVSSTATSVSTFVGRPLIAVTIRL